MKYSTTQRLRRLGIYTLQCVGLVVGVWVIAFVLYKTQIIPCVPTQRMKIGDTKLWICIAATETEQVRGLSYSRHLPKNWGMLFVFEDYSHHKFWMKDMNYPIDILWLDDSYMPVEVARNAKPSSYPAVFSPVYANRFVLETRPYTIIGPFPAVEAVNN